MSQQTTCTRCGRNLPSGWPQRLCPSCFALVRKLRASGAGLASTTFGRSRRFTDRKKESDRNACRGRDLRPSE